MSHVRRRVCPVCWWGDRTQPETLLATREREEVERRVKALGAKGITQQTRPATARADR